jgi:hypothetical protein
VARKAGPHAAVDNLEGLKAGNLRPPSSVDALSGGLAASGEGRLSVSGGFSSGTLSRSGGALASRSGGGESPTKASGPAAPLPDSFDDALAAKGARATTSARLHRRAAAARAARASVGKHLPCQFYQPVVCGAGAAQILFAT